MHVIFWFPKIPRSDGLKVGKKNLAQKMKNWDLQKQGWAIAHHTFQKCDCVITLFFALLKSIIEQFHFFSLFSKVRLCNCTFWHSFQKCDCTIAFFKRLKKNAIAWSLFLKEWMRENVQKSANVRIALFSLFKNGQLPNPACWAICTLKISFFAHFRTFPLFKSVTCVIALFFALLKVWMWDRHFWLLF